jgi:hypothetical protein
VAYIVENLGSSAEPAGNFTATVNWGDGTKPTTGTVAAIPGGDWVVGNHAYASSGPYTITITVKEGGIPVVATAEAFDPPAVPGGPSRHFHRRTVHSRHRTHAQQRRVAKAIAAGRDTTRDFFSPAVSGYRDRLALPA